MGQGKGKLKRAATKKRRVSGARNSSDLAGIDWSKVNPEDMRFDPSKINVKGANLRNMDLNGHPMRDANLNPNTDEDDETENTAPINPVIPGVGFDILG